MSDIKAEELRQMRMSESDPTDEAIDYLIQTVLDQERFIVRQGGNLVLLLRAEAEFRQTSDRLEKETAQLRSEIERLKKSQQGK